MTGIIKATSHFLLIVFSLFLRVKLLVRRRLHADHFRCILFCSMAIMASITPSLARTITLSPQEVFSSIQTNATKNLEGSITVLSINKGAQVILKYSRIKKVRLDCDSEGLFKLDYTIITPEAHQIPPLFPGQLLFIGSASLELDLRSCFFWDAQSIPILLFEGTGKFGIKSISLEPIEEGEDVLAENNWAIFLMPERIRNTTVNFLSPRYWNFESHMLWPNVLGKTILLVSAMLWVGSLFFRWINSHGLVPLFGITGIVIYSLYFLLILIPMLHTQVFITNENKIRQNYMNPEFGELAARARELIDREAKVAIYGEEADWFSPQTLCFNIAPTKCVFAKPNTERYSGISGITELKSSEIDTIVFFNSALPLPEEFQKISEINPNAFIAQKK